MTLQSIITKLVNSILAPAVPILIGVAVVLFMWGLVKYINSGFGDNKKVGEARDLMIWGIISIAVMVSVWGLVALVQSVFLGGSVPTTAPTPPYFNKSGTSDWQDIPVRPNPEEFPSPENFIPPAPVCNPDANPGTPNACPNI